MHAAQCAALLTFFDTVFAQGCFTTVAFADAGVTEGPFADGTDRRAILAEVLVALIADIPVVFIDLPAAVTAGPTVPVRQQDIGTAGVVGIQYPHDHIEKVKQPALN